MVVGADIVQLVLGRRRRPEPRRPTQVGTHEGLAFALYVPDGEPIGGLVSLHGAGSTKESHLEFCRSACDWGIAAVAFDARGHGASEGEFGAGAIDDVAAISELLPSGPRALRGSSMGGYIALLAAPRLQASAVVAICPASADGLLRGLRANRWQFRADVPGLERFLHERSALDAARALRAALLLMHAEGDEQVPVEHSRELLAAAGSERKRLIAPPGGHHRSVQHDAELQGESLRFLQRELKAAQR
ncbi:MAG: alpha/beta hydrolase [Solirubrobacteraceae bacterium]